MAAFEQQSPARSDNLANTAWPDRVDSRFASIGNPLLAQQQALGNQAVQRLLDSLMVQAKLMIDEPGNQYEQEADRVADALMRMPGPNTTKRAAVDGQAQGARIQRMCSECEEELHRQPTKEEEETLQAKEVPVQTSEVTPDVQAVINDLRGRGQPLPKAVRAFFEPRFGHDFSHVRVHVDARAAETARAVNALAFTVGRDMVFGAEQYAPSTSNGRQLLAHELTHVVQQQAPNLKPQRAPKLSHPKDLLEVEADQSSKQRTDYEGIIPVGDAFAVTRPSHSVGIQRRWDAAPEECGEDTPEPWIRQVIVQQETPQSVALEWSDGTSEEGLPCSSGKGWCCVPDENPTATACTEARSRESGTNCTPLGSDHRIQNRDLDHRGIPFWSEFVPGRGIALHEYSPVDQTPLSHGCVRLQKDTARKIFCNVRQNRTIVEVTGFARPRCIHPTLQTEWSEDFAEAAGPEPSDPRERRLFNELRRSLRGALGLPRQFADFGSLTVPDDIPRCVRTTPLPTAPTRPGGASGSSKEGAGESLEVPGAESEGQVETSEALATLLTLRNRAVADALPLSSAQREELDRA